MPNEIVITDEKIESLILTIRGKQVMLDRDLAVLYNVDTRSLNQAVKRNIERFPQSFMFQLNEDEFNNWKSQYVMSNQDKMGLRRPPFAFTEQGVSMLSAVLHSPTAISISIKIIQTFVEMRKTFQQLSGVIQRIENVETKQIKTDQKLELVFKALENKNDILPQGVFFNGQIFDAYELTSKIIRSAKISIILIDNYIDETTITHLAKKNKAVKCLILTKEITPEITLDIKKANQQYKNFKVITFNHSHDRFLIIDNTDIYHLGASIKDLGKKWFAFSKLDKASVDNIIKEINKII
jgi:hypothetical protein